MSTDRQTHAVTRLFRALEHTPDIELTLPQYRVLGLLAAGDVRAGHLATGLAVTRPTVTALVDSLVERGFVVREQSAGDRRSVTVSITEAGQRAVAATGASLRRTLDDIVSRCDDPDGVRAALDQLVTALDSWWDDRKASAAASGAVRR